MNRSLAVLAAVAAAGLGLAALAPPRGACGASYTVVRGDTLSAIARHCGSSVAAIARASNVADPDLILVGQRLTIPGAVRAAQRRRPASARSYAMARGDTLFSLARWSGVDVRDLLAANPGIDPRRIEIGEPVRLPAGARDPLALRSRERGAGAAPARAAPRPAASPRARPDRPTAPRAEEREPLGM